ncbi:MAG: acyltransferase [Nitrososphaerota archaeon]|nr:acyltransferase [Nitrososphaerota archaeon]
MKMSPDSSANLAKAEKLIGKAANKGAQIVCLPELFTTPYFPQEERATTSPEVIPGKTTRALGRIAKDNEVVLIAGSLYEKSGDRLYNTSVVFDTDGKMLGKYRKVHIPQDESFYEQNYFSSGDTYDVFSTMYGKVAVLICFDQWYPEPARICRLLGAEFIFYPTAIGSVDGIQQTEGDWHDAWESVQRGHAIANSVVVAAVNRVGKEGRMRFWGRSFVSDQFGKILFRADGDEGVFVVECDRTLGVDVETGWGFIANRKPKTYSKIVK